MLISTGLYIVLFICVTRGEPASTQGSQDSQLHVLPFTERSKSYDGPIALAYINPEQVLVSEKTCVSTLNLDTGEEELLLGVKKIGGYQDGFANESRFSLINDIVVQGNFAYIADYGCIRMYDMRRNLVGTLVGSCGWREGDLNTVVPPTFTEHLKLAVTARDLYVLDADTIWRVDKETGSITLLSSNLFMSEGHATSIEADPFSNLLFVAVAGFRRINIIAIDIASGQQRKFTKVVPRSGKDSSSSPALTANVASLDIAPNGTIYLLHPLGLSTIGRKTKATQNFDLDSMGYHEVVVSSKYTVISQEYYSLMYHLHIHKNAKVEPLDTANLNTGATKQETANKDTQPVFGSQGFYIAVIFPSILFLLVIVASVCILRRVVRTRKRDTELGTTTVAGKDEYFYVKQQDYWM